MTIQQPHHDCFSGPARARDFGLFVFVHVSGEAADKSFVGFNFRSVELLHGTILHSETDTMIHKPGGLLRDAEATRGFRSR